MPFNIGFICFIFIPCHFPPPFCCFFVPSNRKYATRYYRFRFRCRFDLFWMWNETVLISNDVFYWTTSCDSKPFESLEWYLFSSYEANTINFQMLPSVFYLWVWIKNNRGKETGTTRCNPGLTDGVCFDRSVRAEAKPTSAHWIAKGTPFIWPNQHYICMRSSDKNSIMHLQTPKKQQEQQIKHNKPG